MKVRRYLGSATVRGLAAAGLTLVSLPALAQEAAAPAVNSGDTAWLLTSTALVMLMTRRAWRCSTGLVRQQNYLSTPCTASSCWA